MTEIPDLTDPLDAQAFVEALRTRGDVRPGSLVLTLASADGHPIGGIGVDELPVDPPQHERIRMLGPLLRRLAEEDLCDATLLAVGRRGVPEPGGSDLAWHDALSAACGVAGLTCLGTFVVTPTATARVEVTSPGNAA